MNDIPEEDCEEEVDEALIEQEARVTEREGRIVKKLDANTRLMRAAVVLGTAMVILGIVLLVLLVKASRDRDRIALKLNDAIQLSRSQVDDIIKLRQQIEDAGQVPVVAAPNLASPTELHALTITIAGVTYACTPSDNSTVLDCQAAPSP